MTRNNIFICKANSYRKLKIIPAEIHINQALPKFENPEAAEKLFDEEAEELYQALKNSLPKGTRIQLLLKLMADQLNKRKK